MEVHYARGSSGNPLSLIHGPGEWLAGCAFVDELDDATLNVYQGARVRPSPTRMRKLPSTSAWHR